MPTQRLPFGAMTGVPPARETSPLEVLVRRSPGCFGPEAFEFRVQRQADGSAVWTRGDYDYNGNVNFGDLLTLARSLHPKDEVLGRAVQVGIGPKLQFVESFCAVHGYPNLACLAVNRESLRPAPGYQGDWEAMEVVVESSPVRGEQDVEGPGRRRPPRLPAPAAPSSGMPAPAPSRRAARPAPVPSTWRAATRAAWRSRRRPGRSAPRSS